MKKAFLLLFVVVFLTDFVSSPAFTTNLRSMGYHLIPAPRKVSLEGGEVAVDRSWQAACEAGADHPAMKALRWGSSELLEGLEFQGTNGAGIVLRIAPGTVTETRGDKALGEQAYRMTISQGTVEITGNSGAGLFYGVQSFLQLMKRDGAGRWKLPAGEIVDWPELELRFIHWDTKHHQDRMETLKRFLDWAACFKINAVGFEIEDKYEFPRHPVIGAPGAFAKDEIQELTRYALERFIQLVPQVQAPSHMAYVLKHEEFAGLRSDGSNYHSCMCDKEAMDLILDIYQDMIDATPGVKYFHASTDEVYYAGICEKCRKPYNDTNRSQYWVDYVNRVHRWLEKRGRRMLCWVEYPLLAEHIQQLPPDLIDAITGQAPDYISNKNSLGMEGLAYSSIQGSELLFPNYFPCTYRGKKIRGRLKDASEGIENRKKAGAKLTGTYAAAWDDSGLHNETFWLGWVTVSQYGWSPEGCDLEQSVADFMDVFYGPGIGSEMVEIYSTLMSGARFFESSLDRVASTETKPTYGNPWGKGRGTTRIDLRLEPPTLPFGFDVRIIVEPAFTRKYGRILDEARVKKPEIDLAVLKLQGMLGRHPVRNRYNLEVLLSLAYFERHFVKMMLGLEEVESLCVRASEAFSERDARRATGHLAAAHSLVKNILAERAGMWEKLKSVWERSRFEKGRSVDGREFVHVLDDLKDHFADRRPGLEYMLAPYERMDLQGWNRKLADFIRSIASSHGLEAPRLGE